MTLSKSRNSTGKALMIFPAEILALETGAA
jgi:hypothetical protein